MSDGFSKDTTPPMKSESPKDYKRCEKCGGAQGYGSAMQGGGLCYCKSTSTPAQPAREAANERTLIAVVKWLEVNQPDVFRRGLWDAVASAQDESREAKAARLVRESGKTVHTNTCATSIAPAEEPGPCDCDAAQPTLPPQFPWSGNDKVEAHGERLRKELTEWLDRNGIVSVLLDTPKNHVDITSHRLPDEIRTVLTQWGCIYVTLEARDNPEGHHASYEPEHWLDVEWLCKTCHAIRHRK